MLNKPDKKHRVQYKLMFFIQALKKGEYLQLLFVSKCIIKSMRILSNYIKSAQVAYVENPNIRREQKQQSKTKIY